MTDTIILLHPSRPAQAARPAPAVAQERAPHESVSLEEATFRCVSSGYPHEDCSCELRIPRGVVLAASRSAADASSEGFFEVAWRGETWVSYARGDGTVTGVYCPAHTLARAARQRGVEREQPLARLTRAA